MRLDFRGLRTQPVPRTKKISGNNLSARVASRRQRSFGPGSRQPNRGTWPSPMDGFLRECISADTRVLRRVKAGSAQMPNRRLAGRVLSRAFHRLGREIAKRRLLELPVVLFLQAKVFREILSAKMILLPSPLISHARLAFCGHCSLPCKQIEAAGVRPKQAATPPRRDPPISRAPKV